MAEVTEYPEVEGYDSGQVNGTEEGYDENNDQFQEVDSSGERSGERKFQSMYDREAAKNRRFEKYTPLIERLENDPEFVQTMQSAITNGQSTKNQPNSISEDEFSPWDAFLNPNSDSYQHVQKEVQKAVSRGVQQQMTAVKEQVFMNDLKRDLQERYDFDDNMVDDFIQFYSTPKEDLPFEALVDVYLKTNNKSEDRSKPASSLDVVRANKQNPQTPGSMQGAGVKPRSDQDRVFDGIKKAGGIGNRLP
tara:strand:- start:6975 stop:7721 length:747 start_codon:yes stop_codon:yes gene_type:complete